MSAGSEPGGPVPGRPVPGPATPAPAGAAGPVTPAPVGASGDTVADAAGPRTGDIVIDAAIADLAAADPLDLDAQIELGERVRATLRTRLDDLGG